MTAASIKTAVPDLGSSPTRLRQVALVAKDIDQARQLLVRATFHYYPLMSSQKLDITVRSLQSAEVYKGGLQLAPRLHPGSLAT
jgi:hypothetical protein